MASEVMQQANINGLELEYEIRGDGEPALLIHGSHVAAAFLPLMEEPALESYRLIRYHRRGFAGSSDIDGPFAMADQAGDALALLRHLGVDRVHVIGHSYGGAAALQLALDAPGVVHSLVLLEPALMMVPSAAAFAEGTLIPAMERYQAGDAVGAVDAFMQDMVTGPDWREEVARTIPGGVEQAEQDAATFFEVEVPALDQWKFDGARAEEITRHVLYVTGSDSHPMFEEGRDMVRSWIPQAEDHVVRDVGHSLQMEDPCAVASAIAGFLSRHPLDQVRNA